MGRAIVLGLAILALTGCGIKKSLYDEQMAVNEELTVRNDGMVRAMNDMGEDILKLQDELKATKRALDQTNKKLAETMAQAGALQKDIDEAQLAMQQLELRKAQTEAAIQFYQGLLDKVKPMAEAGVLAIQVDDGIVRLVLPMDAMFVAGGNTLSAEGKRQVQQIAGVLSASTGRRYQVVTHTDDSPDKSASTWDLGATRAVAVTRQLLAAGVGPDRISAATYADSRPVASNASKDGKAANRRVEIVVVPDLTGLPEYAAVPHLLDKPEDIAIPAPPIGPAVPPAEPVAPPTEPAPPAPQ